MGFIVDCIFMMQCDTQNNDESLIDGLILYSTTGYPQHPPNGMQLKNYTFIHTYIYMIHNTYFEVQYNEIEYYQIEYNQFYKFS